MFIHQYIDPRDSNPTLLIGNSKCSSADMFYVRICISFMGSQFSLFHHFLHCIGISSTSLQSLTGTFMERRGGLRRATECRGRRTISEFQFHCQYPSRSPLILAKSWLSSTFVSSWANEKGATSTRNSVASAKDLSHQ
mgnify:CR=1 FL=1